MTRNQRRIAELVERIEQLERALGQVDSHPAIRRVPGARIALFTGTALTHASLSFPGLLRLGNAYFLDYDPAGDKWVRTDEIATGNYGSTEITDVLGIFGGSFPDLNDNYRRGYGVQFMGWKHFGILQAACELNAEDNA